MNICDKLALYLYKEMNQAEMEEFKIHLQNCKNCKENIKIFTALKENKISQNVHIETIDKIFDKTTRKKPFWTLLRKFEIGFVGLCLIFGVIFLSNKTKYEYDYYDNISTSYYDDLISFNESLDEYEELFKA